MLEKQSSSRASRLVRLLPIVLILGACATGTMREKLLTLPVIDGASYVGMETCAGCHDEKMAEFKGNVHSRLAKFELYGVEKGCESCHGAGSLHVDGGGDTGKINQPAKLSADQSAAICVSCHTGGSVMEWSFSEHALADLSCSDCHTMHGDGSGSSLKARDPELCYGCHQEQLAKANFPSHHPIKEGKMNCSACHNPHGALQTEETARDLCLECHSRYQGPFVYEHGPVEEDCNICHDPHGTVANNLLQQNEPFLCLQCHESHFHAARVGGDSGTASKFAFDGNKLDAFKSTDPALYNLITTGIGTAPSGATYTAPLTPAQADAETAAAGYGTQTVTVPFTNAVSGADGWSRGFLTKCTVCHSVVHGSDLPSQTVPVIDSNGDGFPDGGSGLTR